MKQMITLLLAICFLGALAVPAFSADPEGKKKKKYSRIIIDDHDLPDDIEVNLEGLEDMLEDLEIQLNNLDDLDFQFDEDRLLQDLEIQLAGLEELEGLEMDLADLEDLNIHIPNINIDLPAIDIDLPMLDIDLPSLDIDLPEINIDGFNFDFDYQDGHSRFYRDLSEKEEMRLQALRSMIRRSNDETAALDALEDVIRNDKSTAMRYEAVRMLRYYLDNDRTLDILGRAAGKDYHIGVRKKALQLLGKSGDPRAVDIIENILDTY